jgi:hypothetical protein
MQIKATLRFHLTAVKIAIIKNTTNNKCWWGCGEKRNPHTLLVGMQISITTVENSMKAPVKTKNRTFIWFSNTSLRDVTEGMWVRLQ